MIYKRKNSQNWYAAFYIKGTDGKLIKRAICTKTTDKIKAADMERDLKRVTSEFADKKRLETFLINTAQMMTEQIIERPGLPISLVWDKYASHATQAKRTKRTQDTKRIIWNRFLKWIQAEFPQVITINDISRDIADKFIKTIQDKSSSNFNNNKNALSSIWQVLTIEAGLKENIWRLFAGAENDSVRYRNFSIDEIRLILANSEGFWRASVAIAYYTGLRFKDVVHLRKSQIIGDYIVLTPAKTKRLRKDVQIYIHADLRKILDAQIQLTESAEDYIFPEAVTQYGQPSFQYAFGKILDRCDLKDDPRGKVGFHSLRHSFVTTTEEMGIDRKVIQSIVGHGSPLMTSHYSHDKKSGKVIDQMPSLTE